MEDKRRKQANGFIGIVLVLIGAGILGAQFFDLHLGDYLWPFFIIVPGLLFFAGMVAGGKKMGGLAIPGSIITMTGLILLYQNTFNHFESWAYMWALIMPTAAGIGMVIHGTWAELDDLAAKGWGVIKIGMFIFLGMGFFFEAVIGLSSSGLVRFLWPAMAILLGVYLLFGRAKKDEPAAPSEPELK